MTTPNEPRPNEAAERTIECAEHRSPASLYDDGSMQCLYCCQVETSCDCTAPTEATSSQPPRTAAALDLLYDPQVVADEDAIRRAVYRPALAAERTAGIDANPVRLDEARRIWDAFIGSDSFAGFEQWLAHEIHLLEAYDDRARLAAQSEEPTP